MASLDGREFEWTLGVGDGQGGLACCNSWGYKESDTTERLNWVAKSYPTPATPWTAACPLLCPPLFPKVFYNSCPLSWWCYITISSSATPFSFCLPSFPASGSFPVSQLFTSGGQSTGALASASVLPMDIQGWFPLELTVRETIFDQAFLGRKR